MKVSFYSVMVKLCTEPYANDEKYKEHFDCYDFALSDFQKYAIEAIVEGHHTLVTAHTGSGKTLPAEFALNYFVKKKKRLIYTSPIKALSNQKYSEFSRKYPHISFGLMTGDIKINPDADVLIMTTEILMNALFLQTLHEQETPSALEFQVNINEELACVVFDEVHYINDADRGQVWEKTILMLPKHIQMIMLSATIDAPEKFAAWTERGDNSKEVYLASTYKRVVPLTHYAYLTSNESSIKLLKDKELEKTVRSNTQKLITLRTDKGAFCEDGYKKVAKMTKLFHEKSMFVKRKHALNNLGLHLKENDMLPAIAFVFSRKLVETCASDMHVNLLEDDSKVPYIVRKECEQIVRKLPNFKEYMELPEYDQLVSLLEKGVGIHHSGMIPILREIVEIMISKKYIKVLFATESFAIGLDCPIKTAVFTSLMKFDGRNERLLYPHEYTQMAGRAGRRGIDTVGHVVHCNNLFSMPEQKEYAHVLTGAPQKLVSKFNVSYQLIFNLMKNEKCNMNDFTSFVENSMLFGELGKEVLYHRGLLEEKENKLSALSQKMGKLQCQEGICERYMELKLQLPMLKNRKRKNAEKEMEDLLKDHPTCIDDAKEYLHCKDVKNEVEHEREEIFYLENYVSNNIYSVCDVLHQHGFLKQDDTTYSFTELGKVASSIAEIHPLVVANVMEETNWLQGFEIEDIASILSLFTNVNVGTEEKLHHPSSKNPCVLTQLRYIDEKYKYYEDVEVANCVYGFHQYESGLCFDMPELVYDWCFKESEYECKYFLQQDVAERSISVGDFTKALLKISTIVREISVVAEKMNQVECLHKLSRIDGKILKYITTSQSLYI